VISISFYTFRGNIKCKYTAVFNTEGEDNLGDLNVSSKGTEKGMNCLNSVHDSIQLDKGIQKSSEELIVLIGMIYQTRV
jgi:hypothetical protein